MALSLIGYRASGKTCVARLLSNQLGWKWIDADVELERREKRSISDLFASEGEPYFRQRERQLLAELLQQDELIIATGGGAILDSETREQMKVSGPVIWLQASAEELAKRIGTDAKSTTQRPSLTGKSATEEVAEVLTAREPLYREVANLQIDTNINRPADIATLITDWLPTVNQGEK